MRKDTNFLDGLSVGIIDGNLFSAHLKGMMIQEATRLKWYMQVGFISVIFIWGIWVYLFFQKILSEPSKTWIFYSHFCVISKEKASVPLTRLSSLSVIIFIDFWSASQILKIIFHRVITHLLLINSYVQKKLF